MTFLQHFLVLPGMSLYYSYHTDVHRVPRQHSAKESACDAEMQETWDPLEEEMATHSSILAWRIP